MRAFKFRSATQIDFALDIIFNSRLYCADWSALNDPMEGMFYYSPDSASGDNPNWLADRIVSGKKRLKVCSLSDNDNSPLMWAHYASGFRGLVLEVDLPDCDVDRVDYTKAIPAISGNDTIDPDVKARELLTSKVEAWRYEKEVRLLSEKEYYPLDQPVQRVVIGHRMNNDLAKALDIICKTRGIEMGRTYIDGSQIKSEPYPHGQGF